MFCTRALSVSALGAVLTAAAAAAPPATGASDAWDSAASIKFPESGVGPLGDNRQTRDLCRAITDEIVIRVTDLDREGRLTPAERESLGGRLAVLNAMRAVMLGSGPECEEARAFLAGSSDSVKNIVILPRAGIADGQWGPLTILKIPGEASLPEVMQPDDPRFAAAANVGFAVRQGDRVATVTERQYYWLSHPSLHIDPAVTKAAVAETPDWKDFVERVVPGARDLSEGEISGLPSWVKDAVIREVADSLASMGAADLSAPGGLDRGFDLHLGVDVSVLPGRKGRVTDRGYDEGQTTPFLGPAVISPALFERIKDGAEPVSRLEGPTELFWLGRTANIRDRGVFLETASVFVMRTGYNPPVPSTRMLLASPIALSVPECRGLLACRGPHGFWDAFAGILDARLRGVFTPPHVRDAMLEDLRAGRGFPGSVTIPHAVGDNRWSYAQWHDHPLSARDEAALAQSFKGVGVPAATANVMRPQDSLLKWGLEWASGCLGLAAIVGVAARYGNRLRRRHVPGFFVDTKKSAEAEKEKEIEKPDSDKNIASHG